MPAEILEFPRKLPPALRAAENLWIQMMNDTPMAKEQANKLIRQLRECRVAIRGDGDAV